MRDPQCSAFQERQRSRDRRRSDAGQSITPTPRAIRRRRRNSEISRAYDIISDRTSAPKRRGDRHEQGNPKGFDPRAQAAEQGFRSEQAGAAVSRAWRFHFTWTNRGGEQPGASGELPEPVCRSAGRPGRARAVAGGRGAPGQNSG
jgi:hypothetical protein